MYSGCYLLGDRRVRLRESSGRLRSVTDGVLAANYKNEPGRGVGLQAWLTGLDLCAGWSLRVLTCGSEACALNMCPGSPKQLLGLVFTRRTHRTQHVRCTQS